MNLARRLSSSFFLDGFYRCKVAYDIALNRPVVCKLLFFRWARPKADKIYNWA
uniref:Uncharacterized protein n=1 Tax=Oryza rufipogon TaxID=4529 RepID=A0A0E0PJS7_ORYRU